MRIKDFAQRQKKKEYEAMQILKNYPYSTFKSYLKGIGAFFLDPGRFDLLCFSGVEIDPTAPGLSAAFQVSGVSGVLSALRKQNSMILLILFVVLIINLHLLMGFALWIFLSKEAPFFKYYLLMTVLYIAIVTGPLGASRFRLAIMPLIIYTGILGFDALKSRVLQRIEQSS
jgi:hypothetical protein